MFPRMKERKKNTSALGPAAEKLGQPIFAGTGGLLVLAVLCHFSHREVANVSEGFLFPAFLFVVVRSIPDCHKREHPFKRVPAYLCADCIYMRTGPHDKYGSEINKSNQVCHSSVCAT